MCFVGSHKVEILSHWLIEGARFSFCQTNGTLPQSIQHTFVNIKTYWPCTNHDLHKHSAELFAEFQYKAVRLLFKLYFALRRFLKKYFCDSAFKKCIHFPCYGWQVQIVQTPLKFFPGRPNVYKAQAGTNDLDEDLTYENTFFLKKECLYMVILNKLWLTINGYFLLSLFNNSFIALVISFVQSGTTSKYFIGKIQAVYRFSGTKIVPLPRLELPAFRLWVCDLKHHADNLPPHVKSAFSWIICRLEAAAAEWSLKYVLQYLQTGSKNLFNVGK